MYRSADHLPFDFTQPGVTMDPVTGWVDFDDPKLHHLYSDQVVAFPHRLGNVTPIAGSERVTSGNVEGPKVASVSPAAMS